MNKIFSRDKNWVLLIAYVALIYSTLPIMPGITAFFSSLLGRNFAVAANSFLIAIIIIIFAFMFKYSLIRRKLISYIAAAVLFAVYLAILLFATPIIAEKMHLLEYGFLSYLTLRAVRGAQPLWKRYIYVIFIIVLVGYCDELIQAFLPNRVYEPKDVFLNIIGGILGLLLIMLVKGPRRLTFLGNLIK